MSIYNISEIFGPTLQAEGLHAGWSCAFLRFQYCCLWPDSSKPSPVCPFCDTRQLHDGSPMDGQSVISAVLKAAGCASERGSRRMGLVISGGEPLMQLDDALLSALSKRFLWVDIETNGTVDPMFQPTDYPNVYMSCSPKTRRIPEWADWYKLLIPAKLDLLPYVLEAVRRLEEYPPRVPQRLYLQAVEVDGITSSETLANVRQAVDLCLEHGATLSFQAHKLIGIR